MLGDVLRTMRVPLFRVAQVKLYSKVEHSVRVITLGTFTVELPHPIESTLQPPRKMMLRRQYLRETVNTKNTCSNKLKRNKNTSSCEFSWMKTNAHSFFPWWQQWAEKQQCFQHEALASFLERASSRHKAWHSLPGIFHPSIC